MEINWEEYNYREDVKVDRYMVEILLEQNPQLHAKYSEPYIEAVYERDKKKDQLTVLNEDLKEKVIPLLDAKIRAEWQDMKDDEGKSLFSKSPTETLISNWIFIQPKYKEHKQKIRKLRMELVDLDYTVNRLKNGVDGVVDRKFTLEMLGNLLINGIYSYGSKSPVQKELGDRNIGEHEVEQSEAINKGMGNRKIIRKKKGE